MEHKIILSTAYLAPVQYYTKFLSEGEVFIEQHENFPKQTYRNRCIVLGANGPVTLVIPVAKGRSGKTKIRDIRIYDGQKWQVNHWRTIFSAYNSSPFFEFYEYDLYKFYEKKYKFLFDFNQEVNAQIIEILEITPTINVTSEFEGKKSGAANYCDIISPKNKIPDRYFSPRPYTQVFSDKFGFTPNLSIIDLIFNEGPNSLAILMSSQA